MMDISRSLSVFDSDSFSSKADDPNLPVEHELILFRGLWVRPLVCPTKRNELGSLALRGQLMRWPFVGLDQGAQIARLVLLNEFHRLRRSEAADQVEQGGGEPNMLP